MARHYSHAHAISGGLLEVPCAICGGETSRLLGTDNGFRVVKCANAGCGFVYVNPRPSADQLQRFYAEYYPETEAAPEAWGREMSAIFRWCRDRLLEQGRSGVLLDVGCSYGHLLELMGRSGWRGVGVEPSPSAARHARVLVGAAGEILNSNFEDAELADESFDAVVCLYVLEHVSDPRGFLARVCRVLRPGGLAIVRVPYTEPLIPLKRLLHQSLIDAPMHLSDFSPRSMERLARAVGFGRVHARVGRLRRSSDPVEHVGALLLGGTGRLVEIASRGRLIFPGSGALSYLMWK